MSFPLLQDRIPVYLGDALRLSQALKQSEQHRQCATLMLKRRKPCASVLKAQISQETPTTTKQWALNARCLFSVWLSAAQTFRALFWFVSDRGRNAERPAPLALSRPCYCTQESADCITVCGWRRRESKRMEGGREKQTQIIQSWKTHKPGADQCPFRQIAWEIVVAKLNIFDVKRAHYSDRCFWFIT